MDEIVAELWLDRVEDVEEDDFLEDLDLFEPDST
jgi:hypothetical protein